MYRIFADNICIYDDRIPSGSLQVGNPVLTLADSSAGSLTMTLYPDSVGYSAVRRFTSEIRVTRDGEAIWYGRVIDEEIGFYNGRILTCEGALAFLNDTVQPRMIYETRTLSSALESILSVHNALSGHQFVPGNIDGVYAEKSFFFCTDYQTTLECLKSVTVDRYGGHLRVIRDGGVWRIDYFSDFTTESGQVIRFGSNLLDFTRRFDMTQLATAVLPRGASKEGFSGDHAVIASDTELGLSTDIDTPPETWTVDRHGSGINGVPPPWALWFRLKLTLSGLSAPEYTAPVWFYYSEADGSCYFRYRDASTERLGGIRAIHTLTAVYDGYDDWEPVSYESSPDFWIRLRFEGDQPEDAHESVVITAKSASSDSANWPKEYVVIDAVNDGVPFLQNETLVKQYGFVEKVVDFPDITDAAVLKTLGERYLADTQFESLILEVSAFDLHYADASVPPLDLYDRVRCVSPPHGLDRLFPVTKIRIPLDRPEETAYTLGTESVTTISGKSAEMETQVNQLNALTIRMEEKN